MTLARLFEVGVATEAVYLRDRKMDVEDGVYVALAEGSREDSEHLRRLYRERPAAPLRRQQGVVCPLLAGGHRDHVIGFHVGHIEGEPR